MTSEAIDVSVPFRPSGKTVYGTTDVSLISGSKKASFLPSTFVVHGAVVIGNMLFAGGGIMSKLGVARGNSIVFELYRESLSCLLLFAFLVLTGGVLVPDRKDWRTVLFGGIAYFFNQACWYIGIKLADPVIGATWQSFGTTLTSAVAVMAGREDVPRGVKAFGMFMCLLGTIYMVIFDSASARSTDIGFGEARLMRSLGGHLSFLLNILGMALYLVVCNSLGTKYPALSVLAWSTFVTSILMALTSSVVIYNELVLNLMCSDADLHVSSDCVNDGWFLTSAMCWPLTYEVMVCSCVAWPLINWASQHADASIVAAYVVFQPMTGCAISTVLVLIMGVSWAGQYDLHAAGLNSIGIAFIVIGLWAIFESQRNRGSTHVKSPAVV